MNKLQMVQNIILTEVRRVGVCSIDDEKLQEAWNIADNIQAEVDKREKEGKHFDDVEWQPDWSQAPDGKVQYFAVDKNGRGGWYVNKPDLCHDHWYWSDFEERMSHDCYDYAPSFNYTGDWRNSLRKRPQ